MRPDPDSVTAFSAHDHHACSSHALQAAIDMAEAQGARLTPVRRRTLEILLESHLSLIHI